ncbi:MULTISPECIES: hypothetical protein [unclassified Streptomyces]|uniref:hypothetical protein n=1 Tax=unclassified Streptomyces TaxID=2593676 RepID=UPI00292E5981|nr:hypothetical protein [Streptomyces sp. ST1015]
MSHLEYSSPGIPHPLTSRAHPGRDGGKSVCAGMRTTALFAALSLAAFVLTELREPDQYKAGTVDLVLPEELGKALTRGAGLAKPDRLVAFVREGALRHSGGIPGDDTTVFAVRMVPEG